jgi:16S rRNA (cytidine1402-2'-O)-methyltransferase
MSATTPLGTLYLVPAPLDFGCEQQASITDVMPLGTLQVAARLTHWIGENAKTTRAVLKRVGEVLPLTAPIQQHTITELPREVHKKGDHTGGKQSFDAKPLLQAALQGHDMGLISEAGMPAVADPGGSVVRAAHALGLRVVPLTGPCSLLLALAASGLNGQNFAFVGYLPIDSATRNQRIKELEVLALKTGQTQLFIEVPHRNTALLQALVSTLHGTTRLSLSSGITLANASTRSCTVDVWAKTGKDAMHSNQVALDLPTVFAVGAAA